MSRISVRETLAVFLIAAAAVFVVGLAIRGINRWSVSSDADDLTARRHLLRVIEGSEAASGSEQDLSRLVASLGTLLRERPDATVDAVFQTAAALGNANPQTLNAIAPSDRWAIYAPLQNSELRDRIASLARDFPVADALRGTARPSERITIPTVPAIWSPMTIVICYLIFCLGFVIAFAITAISDERHPIVDAPWNRVPGLLMFAATAPASIPGVLVYGLIRLWSAEIPWRERWTRTANALRTVGYRLRILRRLPAPVVRAVALPASVATVAPAAAVAPPPPAASAAAQEEDDDDETDEDDSTDEDETADDEPEWIVVHPDEILGREHLLAAANVPFYPIAIGLPEPLKGFAVETDRIEEFERVLELGDAETEDFETDVERTVRRRYDGEIGETVLSDVPSERVELVERVVETVSANFSALKIAFTDANGYGAHSSVSGHDWVEVLHYASPRNDGQKKYVRGVFGHQRSGDRHMRTFEAAADRGLVISDESGTAVVQVVGRKVFLLADLLSLEEPWQASALARAVYEGVRVAKDGRLDDDGDAVTWRSAIDVEREKYVSLCLERVDARRVAIEREIEGFDSGIQESGKRIAELVRKRHGAAQALSRLVSEERVAEADRLRKEFDALAAAKPVLAVRAYADRVEADTRTVFITHMGHRYEIGRFRITISERGDLSLRNLSNTATRTDCEHPHVRDKRPCLGNLTESVAKLLGERDYALVINLLFRFLESYSPAGRPYANIELWKEVSP